MLIAWLAFPAALAALALGCGLLVDVASGRRVPGALLLPVGLAAIVVAAQFATLSDVTAELATPLVVALALAGFVIDRPWRRRRPDPWAAGAAIAAFLVYGAPVLARGSATFAGYLKLDDTATWLALTDRVLEHGRSLGGLPPSTYEAALHFNLGQGYPVGVFLPFGIGSHLVGQDPAWTFQPYLAVLAATVALAIWALAAPLVRSRPARAAVAFLAAQPALLFGYAMWGGVKELAAAALIPLVAGLAFPALGGVRGGRLTIAMGIAVAALAGVLSIGGLIWVAPIVVAALVAGARSIGAGPATLRLARAAALTGVLALPVIAGGGALPPTAAPLTSADAHGNLFGPLDPLQVVGIWPAGDFRLAPNVEPLTAALIAVAIAAAGFGVLAGRERSGRPLAGYVLGALASCAAIVALGSPWVDAKALAIAAPAVVLAAGVGAAALLARGRVVLGAAAAVALAGGVVWSNALAYREVDLAPRGQLAELERIGDRIAGQGPTLITEYEPYAARHFLRDAAPESVSELRRRRIPLRNGHTVRKGHGADTDQLDLGALLTYRTLVVRRSPAQSRPPSPYRLVERGASYEVWQRPAAAVRPAAHLPLGDPLDPTGVPRCSQVTLLARRAGPDGHLLAAAQPRPVVVRLGRLRHPAGWGSAHQGSRQVVPRGAGTLRAHVRVATRGEYAIWLGGSVRGLVEVAVDGHEAGSVRHELNSPGEYIRLGGARLGRGRHEVTLTFGGADLHPGSGGLPFAAGPLTLSRGDPADERLETVPASRARALCGRRWDWIEAFEPGARSR